MIDLAKSILPQSITVGGVYYRIKTGFKNILAFQRMLKDNAPLNELDFIYVSAIPYNRQAGVIAICDFINCKNELPRSIESGINEPVIDYDIDSDYIYAAFLEQYGIDLITTNLHWHVFSALLHGLHDTELNRIISHRLWKPSGQKETEYDRYQRRQHEAWRLPDRTDNQPDEAAEDFLRKL